MTSGRLPWTLADIVVADGEVVFVVGGLYCSERGRLGFEFEFERNAGRGAVESDSESTRRLRLGVFADVDDGGWKGAVFGLDGPGAGGMYAGGGMDREVPADRA
jgi:hypothetical protein